MKRFVSILLTWALLVVPARGQVAVPLRQSTGRTVIIGPFVDRTNATDAETGLGGNGGNLETNILLSKNGGTLAARNSTTDPAHDADGYYTLPLSTTDTNTLGPLLIQADDGTTYQSFRQWFYVMDEQQFDSLYPDSTATGDVLQVDATLLGGFGWGGDDAPENLIGFFDNGGVGSSRQLDQLSTLTQTQVTGGAYALNSASFAFNSAVDLTSTMKTSVQTAATASLNSYDPPTRTEATADKAEILLKAKPALVYEVASRISSTVLDLDVPGGYLFFPDLAGYDVIVRDVSSGAPHRVAYAGRVTASAEGTPGNLQITFTPAIDTNFFTATAGDIVELYPAGIKTRSDVADILVDTGTTLDGKLNTIDTILDNIFTAFELDGSVYRLTTNAVEQVVTGSLDPEDITAIAEAIGESLITPEDIWTYATRTLSGSIADFDELVDGSEDGEAMVQAALTAQGYTTARAAYIDKAQYLPSATAGASGGLVIAGSNAATTFATLTSTGTFSINGTGMVAQTGDAYGRLGAPAGASIAADLLAVDNFVDDLETRVTATRAGYWDNLSAGAVAQQSTLSTVGTNVSTALTRIGTPASSLAAVIDLNLDAKVSEVEGGGGGGGLSAAETRAALGLNAANLDDQLAALPTAVEIRTEMDSNSTDLNSAVTQSTTAASESTSANSKAADIQSRLPATLDSGLMRSNATLTADEELIEDLAEQLVLAGVGGAPISPKTWSQAWDFDSVSRITANNVVSENGDFNGIIAMKFKTALAGSRIYSIGTATITPTTGVEPQLGTPVVDPTNTVVLVPVNIKTAGGAGVPADVGTYTITVPILTTDNQNLSRKGLLNRQ